MGRKMIQMMFFTAGVLLLAGCAQSIEEQVTTAIASAETKFEEKPMLANKEIGQLSLYLPSGYSIKAGETDTNYIVTKGQDEYIFFVNPLEEANSQLHYQLLTEDETKVILKEEKFEQDGLFGFLAVVEHSNEQFEIIVSIGGKKMTTISSERNIDDKIVAMMEMIRSVTINK